ncbi:MAG: hypothetical protein KGI75_07035, partial [Rhizobiaceae bacterium]|nr:hypothetical protein [Rhizobiaceae bacterium]
EVHSAKKTMLEQFQEKCAAVFRPKLRKDKKRAISGKVRSGFPSGIAKKQTDRAVLGLREKLNRSRRSPCASR